MVQPEDIRDYFLYEQGTIPLLITQDPNKEYWVVGLRQATEYLSAFAIRRSALSWKRAVPFGDQEIYINYMDWNKWLVLLSNNNPVAFNLVYLPVVYYDLWFLKTRDLIDFLLNKSLVRKLFWEGEEEDEETDLTSVSEHRQLLIARALYLLNTGKYIVDKKQLLAYYGKVSREEPDLRTYYRRCMIESPLPPQIDEGILETLDDAGMKFRLSLT